MAHHIREGGLSIGRSRQLAPLLLHADHLVAHDLAPVGAVLVGLDHRHHAGRVVHQQHRLLLALALHALSAVPATMNTATIRFFTVPLRKIP